MVNGISYLLCGVDGGGTGCRAAIAYPDGTIAARASGGPANYTTDPAQAARNVLDAIRSAAAQLGGNAVSPKALVAHIGLAGIMSAADSHAMASNLPFASCSVSDDRITSAIGALGSRDGVLLAIGTGSFAAARRGEDIRFFGGWGLSVGDQASGAWLGRALLEYSLLAWEGLEAPSDLTRAIMLRFDGQPASIISHVRNTGPAGFAEFAPQIIAAARAEDEVGLMLMRRGAAYLDTVLKCADITGNAPICLSGGIGPHYEDYLAPRYHGRIRAPEGTALDGALRLARQKLEELEKQP